MKILERGTFVSQSGYQSIDSMGHQETEIFPVILSWEEENAPTPKEELVF